MKVTVENFQSIKRAEIDVDGFTVITGSNNSGKTALMRAVRGAFQNTPGTAFVRHGEDNCRVEIDLGDTNFSWEKGKKKPTYEIEGKVLNPGKEVPDEVAATGVRPIKAGGREIWPQMAPQFTGQVFLVDQPGSVLAEAVADVERVGKLNRALKAAESDKRSATSEVKVRRKDLETHQNELQGFDGLDEVQAKVEALETAAAQASKIEQAVAGLSKLSERLTGARETVSELEGADVIEVPSRDDIQDIVAVGRDCKALEELKANLDEVRAESEALEPLNQALSVAENLEALGDIDLTPLSELEALKANLAQAQDKLSGLEAALGGALKDLQEEEDLVSEILGGLSECPTCGAAVGEGHDHKGAHA